METRPETGSCEWGGVRGWAATASLLKDNVLGVPEPLRLGGHSCIGGSEKNNLWGMERSLLALCPTLHLSEVDRGGGWRVLRLPAVEGPGISVLRHLCL